jgi:hypothetical protein
MLRYAPEDFPECLIYPWLTLIFAWERLRRPVATGRAICARDGVCGLIPLGDE